MSEPPYTWTQFLIGTGIWISIGIAMGYLSWWIKQGRHPILGPLLLPITHAMRAFGRDIGPTVLADHPSDPNARTESLTVHALLWPFRIILTVGLYLVLPFLAVWMWFVVRPSLIRKPQA